MRGSKGVDLNELRGLYERRLGEFQRVAAAIVGDRERACDVVQEAFVRAVRQRAGYAGRGSVEGWVWRIVVNAARDARSREWELLLSEPDLLAAVDDPSVLDGRREVVRAAVAQLPERQRFVLFLRYYAELEYGTIAAALDISPGTVAATLHAAHARLRDLLAEVRR
jgi:RNA polymerase sigma factor (sigma-70 family)